MSSFCRLLRFGKDSGMRGVVNDLLSNATAALFFDAGSRFFYCTFLNKLFNVAEMPAKLRTDSLHTLHRHKKKHSLVYEVARLSFSTSSAVDSASPVRQ